MITLQHCLRPEAIVLADKAANAQEVIATLAGHLADQLGIARETLEAAILEREATRTTALGNGVAIPHCRLADLKQFGAALMILRQPVRWDNEGHAVDVVVMIAGPSENVADHLRLLSNCSQLFGSASVRAKIKRAPDPRAAFELLTAAEEAVEANRSREGLLREIRKDQANGGDHLAEVSARFEW